MRFEKMINGSRSGDKLMETLLWRGFAVVPHRNGLLLHECSHEKDVATLKKCGLVVQRFERPGVKHRFWIPPQLTPKSLMRRIFDLAACNGMTGMPPIDESFATFKTNNYDTDLYVEGLDVGVALLVKGLNQAGVFTVMSCDGHEEEPPKIWLRTSWDYLWCQYVLHQVWPQARLRHPWAQLRRGRPSCINTSAPVPRPSVIWKFVDAPRYGWMRYFFTWEWPSYYLDESASTRKLIQAFARELLSERTSTFLLQQRAAIACEGDLLDLFTRTRIETELLSLSAKHY